METVTIIENVCLSKTGNEESCEDGLYIGSDYIAVIDGVTCSGGTAIDGKTGGRFAKDILCRAFLDLPSECDAKEAILWLNHVLQKAIEDEGIWKTLPLWSRPQAALIVYSVKRKEIWSFGDCQCMINGHCYRREKEVDHILASVRALVNEIAIREGQSLEDLTKRDAGREYILPLIQKQRIFANSEGRFAYDIVNGGDIHPEHVQVYPVPMDAEVVLASDGYKVLGKTLRETEEILARMLQEDALCIHDLQETKGVTKNQLSFDDRTYVRFCLK